MRRPDDPVRMDQMRAWLRRAAAELGLDPDVVLEHEEALLGLVAAVAHGPSRPGAPLTAFLVGVAVGRGAEASASAARVTELAGAWSGAGDEEVAQVHHVAGHHQDALGAGEPASGEEQRDAE